MQKPIVRSLGLPLAVAALALMITAPAGAYPSPGGVDGPTADPFWQAEGGWSDPQILKGIREGDGTDRWEVLSSPDQGANWVVEGTLEASQYLSLPAPRGEVGALYSQFDQVLLIGSVDDGGVSHWVAGVVTGGGYAWNDRAGNLVQRFTPFLVADDPGLIAEFAQTYLDLYDGSTDRRTPSGPGGQDCLCRDNCSAQLNFSRAICAATSAACVAGADAVLIGCTLGCAGAPPCLAFCLLGYNAAVAVCTLTLIGCRQDAMNDYQVCMALCPPEPE